MVDGIQIQRIATQGELDAAAATWDSVQQACPEKHVLLDHRWVSAWWRHFCDGKEAHMLMLRRGADVVGIVPLVLSRGYEVFPTRDSYVQIAEDFQYVKTPWFGRWVPIRRLTFPLSIASSNMRSHFLLAEDEPDCYRAIMNYVASIDDAWDLLILEGLPRTSGQMDRIYSATKNSTLSAVRKDWDRRFGFTPLPDTMQAYLSSQSRHFRKRLKHACNQAERHAAELGKLELRQYRGPDIDAGMDILFAIEGRSWKTKRDRDRRLYISLDDRIRTFHREVARAFAARDEAQVLVMAVADQPIVALHTLEGESRAAAILIYFDDACADRFTAAPLFRHFIEQSIERDLTEIDFNGTTANVRKWAQDARVCERFMSFNQHVYSRMLGGADRAAHALSRRLRRAKS